VDSDKVSEIGLKISKNDPWFEIKMDLPDLDKSLSHPEIDFDFVMMKLE
jgi:hypothetical protein